MARSEGSWVIAGFCERDKGINTSGGSPGKERRKAGIFSGLICMDFFSVTLGILLTAGKSPPPHIHSSRKPKNGNVNAGRHFVLEQRELKQEAQGLMPSPCS